MTDQESEALKEIEKIYGEGRNADFAAWCSEVPAVAREDTERPALDVLTGHLDLGHLIDLDGTPSECEDGLYRCPFCKGETQSPHDPGESDFHCMLLDRTVWGETAPCTRMDWQERARRELGVRDTEQEHGK